MAATKITSRNYFQHGRIQLEHIIAWLTLQSVPGIGNLLFRRLITHFGSAQSALTAEPDAYAGVPGITPRLVRAIHRQRTPSWVQEDLTLARRKGYAVVTQNDSEYPTLLLEIPDPPPILYVYGELSPEEAAVAVVGSRKASSYGLTAAHGLCKGLAAHGVTVVSGMARGIDSAAHKGALAGGGRTVAVLGSGLECIYPAENRTLFHQIAENGAVISEFPLHAQPDAHHFPKRNRVISGLSLGTVVVEAQKRSGSLITARLAAEQGREVYAVPGNIHAATSQGTHLLIQQGAKLVGNVEDIITEFAHRIHSEAMGPHGVPQSENSGAENALTTSGRTVFEAIGAYAVHVDDLIRRLDMDAGELGAILVQLELRGMIRREPGNHFVRHSDFMDR
jgi:DNA processing protein